MNGRTCCPSLYPWGIGKNEDTFPAVLTNNIAVCRTMRIGMMLKEISSKSGHLKTALTALKRQNNAYIAQDPFVISFKDACLLDSKASAHIYFFPQRLAISIWKIIYKYLIWDGDEIRAKGIMKNPCVAFYFYLIFKSSTD